MPFTNENVGPYPLRTNSSLSPSVPGLYRPLPLWTSPWLHCTPVEISWSTLVSQSTDQHSCILLPYMVFNIVLYQVCSFAWFIHSYSPRYVCPVRRCIWQLHRWFPQALIISIVCSLIIHLGTHQVYRNGNLCTVCQNRFCACVKLKLKFLLDASTKTTLVYCVKKFHFTWYNHMYNYVPHIYTYCIGA